MSYCDRLTKLGLHALQLRRLHFDLLFCYKIVFGLVNVNFRDFIEFRAITNTRGHKYKLFKPRCTSSLRQKFFVDRVVNVWNALPSTVNFSTLTAFRNSIDKVDFFYFALVFRMYSFIVLIVPLYVFTGSCQCSNWTLLSCSLLHVHVSALLYFIEQIK